MTPSGHIRRDLRTDNQGGLRVVIEDVEHITCANCGLTMHVDQWLDEEGRQIRRSRA